MSQQAVIYFMYFLKLCLRNHNILEESHEACQVNVILFLRQNIETERNILRTRII